MSFEKCFCLLHDPSQDQMRAIDQTTKQEQTERQDDKLTNKVRKLKSNLNDQMQKNKDKDKVLQENMYLACIFKLRTL